MFQKVFAYAGPHKRELYKATFLVLLSVLMGVLPFVLAYQVIACLLYTSGGGQLSGLPAQGRDHCGDAGRHRIG